MSGEVDTGAPIQEVRASVYRVPTATAFESDGTMVWNGTTMVLVEATAGGETGIGYTYSDQGAAAVVRGTLAKLVTGKDHSQVTRHWHAMLREVRNIGPGGIAIAALSAVDAALWDLKARLLKQPLALTLGLLHEHLPAYGSGGFTSFTEAELARHLAHLVELGFRRVKMKVGREPDADPSRVVAARRAIGGDTELYVDANGGYGRKQALGLAKQFSDEANVTWLEEPVSSEDLHGLRLIRDEGPPGMDVAAGEYGYSAAYFREMLAQGAVDVLQADATRCGGLTGFLEVAALCRAFGVPLSSHCAPALHLHVCAAAPSLRHMEFFFDHVRMEELLFAGTPDVKNGLVGPDLSRAGNGLILKRQDAARYGVNGL